MNHLYRSIWNHATGTYVAVSEISKSRGQSSASTLCSGSVLGRFAMKALSLGVILGFGSTLYALPNAGVVTAGSATITNNGASGLTITQTSQNAALNWQSFNVGLAESVKFAQPNSSSVALNRVMGSDPSRILGRLTANGQVFLVNPNGILFGKDASVNVGGLVASTLDLTDKNFISRRYRFDGSGKGSVSNLGTLQATDGGYIALMGASINNAGTIVANGGTVAMAAGGAMTLDVSGDGLLHVQIDKAAVNALVSNGGLIQADGGTVFISTQARDALLNTVVNNTGIVQANSVGFRNGRIVLDGGDSGVVRVGGELRAAGVSAETTGGTIVATGDKVLIADQAHLDATGAAGGGGIYVGGGWQGGDPKIKQASGVYIAQSATLDASATNKGNGGTVVAWSDVKNPQSATRVYGSLLAKGGAAGGNGGRIETSGHWLDVAGIRVNAAASLGKGGQWLLDPEDLVVGGPIFPITDATCAPGPIPNCGTFTSGAGSPNVLNTDIQDALSTGVDVTLQTAPTGGGNGDILVNADIAYTGVGTRTLTLKAHNDITIAAGVSISSSVGALDVILNSDSDATGGGSITLNTGAGISTNGGNIVIGGGAAPTTDYAVGTSTAATNIDGVRLHPGSSLNSAGGNISILGKSFASAASAVYHGIYAEGDIDSGTGTITMDGISQGTVLANNQALFFGAGTMTSAHTGANAIQLSGTASPGTDGFGVNLNGVIQTTAGGDITITGTGAAASASILGHGHGLGIGVFGDILSDSGQITLTGIAGDPFSADVSDWGFGGTAIGQKAATAVPSSSSDITINADTIDLANTHVLESSGNLLIQPRTPFIDIDIGMTGGLGTLQLPASFFANSLAPGFSSITVGNLSAGTITINAATSLHDAATFLTGADIVINDDLSAIGETLTLTGGNGGMVSGSGNIAAASLLLNGSGTNYFLDTALSNNVGTLAADTGTGNVSFYNSTALNIGTVGATNGISTSGLVDVATLSGNLTVSQNIATTDSSPFAIVLNAGLMASAPATAGGNLIIAGGSITTGVGGLATLFTGSVAGSTGLTTLVGSGSGRFRYNNDEAWLNPPGPLPVPGLLAIYREQPAVTVTANPASKTYDGLVYSGGYSITTTGLVNGDTLTGTATFSGTSQTAVNAGGGYTIIPAEVSSAGLGYAPPIFVAGVLTINPAPLVPTAISASLTGSVSKNYDGTTLATLSPDNFLLNGWVGSDGAVVTKASGTYDNANAGINKNVTVNLSSSDYAATGSTNLGNYTLPVTVSGNVGVINKANLTVTADSQTRLYGAPNPVFSQTISGFVNGETSVVVSGTATGSSTADVSTGVGTSVITASATGLTAANYDFPTLVNGVLTINKANLTVTADPQARLYGAPNPVFSQTISGFVNGETSAVVSGTATGSSTADVTTGVGTSVITASATGLTAANYDFPTLVDGVLTIDKALLDDVTQSVQTIQTVSNALTQPANIVTWRDKFDVDATQPNFSPVGTIEAASGNDATGSRSASNPSPGIPEPLVPLAPLAVAGGADGGPASGTTEAGDKRPDAQTGASQGTSRFRTKGFTSKPLAGGKSGTLVGKFQTAAGAPAAPDIVFLRGAAHSSLVGATTSGVVLIGTVSGSGNKTRMSVMVAVGEGFKMTFRRGLFGNAAGEGAKPLIQALSAAGGSLPSWITFNPSDLSLAATSVPTTGLPLTIRLTGPAGKLFEVTFK